MVEIVGVSADIFVHRRKYRRQKSEPQTPFPPGKQRLRLADIVQRVCALPSVSAPRESVHRIGMGSRSCL